MGDKFNGLSCAGGEKDTGEKRPYTRSVPDQHVPKFEAPRDFMLWLFKKYKISYVKEFREFLFEKYPKIKEVKIE